MLMKLQQDQLEKLRQWLTNTEDRICQMGAGQQPDNLAAAIQLLQDHQTLQNDLMDQQEYVNSLSNMVVIVDEAASDSKFHSNWTPSSPMVAGFPG